MAITLPYPQVVWPWALACHQVQVQSWGHCVVCPFVLTACMAEELVSGSSFSPDSLRCLLSGLVVKGFTVSCDGKKSGSWKVKIECMYDMYACMTEHDVLMCVTAGC